MVRFVCDKSCGMEPPCEIVIPCKSLTAVTPDYRPYDSKHPAKWKRARTVRPKAARTTKPMRKFPGFGEVAANSNKHYKWKAAPELPIFGRERVVYDFIKRKLSA